MGSLKSPCTTSYRSSIETIALNCLVCEKIALFCILATDRQTNKQMDTTYALSRSCCRERRLNNLSVCGRHAAIPPILHRISSVYQSPRHLSCLGLTFHPHPICQRSPQHIFAPSFSRKSRTNHQINQNRQLLSSSSSSLLVF